MSQSFEFTDATEATTGAITAAALIAELKRYAPDGVELPKDVDSNSFATSTMTRWAQDAAGKINLARGKTTKKETTITLTEDEQDYDLPSDCREVKQIIRSKYAPSSGTTTLDVPDPYNPLAYGSFGVLPTGQAIGGSLQLINQQNIARMRREDEYELFGGQIRFKFPIEAGEQIRVQYIAVDRSLASIPEDYFEQVLLYMRYKHLDWFIAHHGAFISVDGDQYSENTMVTIVRQKTDLLGQWNAFINSISDEAN